MKVYERYKEECFLKYVLTSYVRASSLLCYLKDETIS